MVVSNNLNLFLTYSPPMPRGSSFCPRGPSSVSQHGYVVSLELLLLQGTFADGAPLEERRTGGLVPLLGTSPLSPGGERSCWHIQGGIGSLWRKGFAGMGWIGTSALRHPCQQHGQWD